MPNYEGPYVVKRALPGGALILTRWMGKSYHCQLTLIQSKSFMLSMIP